MIDRFGRSIRVTPKEKTAARLLPTLSCWKEGSGLAAGETASHTSMKNSISRTHIKKAKLIAPASRKLKGKHIQSPDYPPWQVSS